MIFVCLWYLLAKLAKEVGGIEILLRQQQCVGWTVGLANMLLDDLAVLVGEPAHDFVVDVLADLATSMLSQAVRLAITTEHFSMLVSLKVVLQDTLVELLVLPI